MSQSCSKASPSASDWTAPANSRSTRPRDFSRQVASGLAAAHARGITHRDINHLFDRLYYSEPENLFFTRDGLVKILDFGLAKQSAGAPQPSDATRKAVSEPGVVMGTAGYMSPEQVKGLPADPRSALRSVQF
ncbi:MAG: hypothetical protein JNK87_08610, partial [Bryobacterales bacterium]|nr:hypothetical protein [Bryobacterales bacterium]